MAYTLAVRLATAGLIGLVVGLEREWSGHRNGSHPRFAGLRTFFLIGLTGGVAGEFLRQGHDMAASALLFAAATLSIAAYTVVSRRTSSNDFDGTTEMAAIAVVGLGTLAALGEIPIAAGAGAVVVLMLGEKAPLHRLVQHIAPEELEGALQFAVLALVVLPLLPAGPFGGILDIEPRVIWSIVLLFSALNYCGYIARRVFGANRGYGVTGLLGGLISSTAVTLQFSRQSRSDPSLASALAIGVVGACTVLLPRVVILSAFIDPAVAWALIPRLLVAAAIGTGTFALLLYRHRADLLHPAREDSPHIPRDQGGEELEIQEPLATAPAGPRNPLALSSSLQMAIAFQLAISLLALVRAAWGTLGLYAGATVLGLTDVDALTVSTAQSGVMASVAAQAILVGITANTVLKALLALVLGHARFQRIVCSALIAMALGNVLVLSLWGRLIR